MERGFAEAGRRDGKVAGDPGAHLEPATYSLCAGTNHILSRGLGFPIYKLVHLCFSHGPPLLMPTCRPEPSTLAWALLPLPRSSSGSPHWSLGFWPRPDRLGTSSRTTGSATTELSHIPPLLKSGDSPSHASEALTVAPPLRSHPARPTAAAHCLELASPTA